MFDKLEKHHIGFIIPKEEKEFIENKFGKSFTLDTIQGAHALFIYDKDLRIYIEYIVKEGRAANQKPGLAHVCYNLKNNLELKKVEDFIKNEKLGYRLTNLEKSGSKECGHIVFYYIKNIGLIELNLLKKD